MKLRKPRAHKDVSLDEDFESDGDALPVDVPERAPNPEQLCWASERRDILGTDFDVEKSFAVPKWEKAQFSVGARFFNLFNHPNFAFPNTNIDSNQFGQITQTVSQPTTIYGSGLGADASPRVIEIQAKFVF
jgi:hypothetical protein